MKSNLTHANQSQLNLLLFGDEKDEIYKTTLAHVESCDLCRGKLDNLSGTEEFDAEARAMLEGFSEDHSATSFKAEYSESDISLNCLSPPVHPEMLGRLGRYEIERVVGRGGMGVVFKGFDTELNRPIALKVLAQHLSHSGAARQRFAREAKAAAAVVHEHVIAIYNVETEGETLFLVMPYVAGESLQARVDREGALDAKEILRIGIQAAAGLEAAHGQGVVHRDIKPGNILLEGGVERALVTDFGLAQTVDDASLTHTGIVAGTPNYMSPEQANGEPTDHRSDLFSLGCVLYFAATGTPPFRADKALGVLNRICHAAHTPLWHNHPDIPDELSDLIDRLLEKKPSHRFTSAGQVQSALQTILANMQRSSPRYLDSVKRFIRRRRANRYWHAGLVALGLLVPVGIMLAFITKPESLQTELATSTSSSSTGSHSASISYSASISSNNGQLNHQQEVVGAPIVPYPSSVAASSPSSTDYLTSDEWEWTVPQNAGPAVNSQWQEHEPFLSADELTLLFRSNRPSGYGRHDLWMATRDRADQPWTEPVNLGPSVNTEREEGCPTMTADGLMLFFHSYYNDGNQKGVDVFVSQRATKEDTWGIRHRLQQPVNSPQRDGYACVLPDGLTLLVSSERPGGSGNYDFWMCKRFSRNAAWEAEAVCLARNLNSPNADFTPKLCLDGRAMLFVSRRLGGYGAPNDLWIATRNDSSLPFTSIVNIGKPINTSAHETGACLSADGMTLWFTSHRVGGQGQSDLWYSRRVRKSPKS